MPLYMPIYACICLCILAFSLASIPKLRLMEWFAAFNTTNNIRVKLTHVEWQIHVYEILYCFDFIVCQNTK